MVTPTPPVPGTPPAGRQQPTNASWLRRIGALCIDWAASSLVAAFILGGFGGAAYQWLPLGVFWLETSLGVALVGGSFGQMLTRVRVLGLNGRPLNLFRAMFRQVLVCLVIPPLVFRADGRGLHDVLNDSAAYELNPN